MTNPVYSIVIARGTLASGGASSPITPPAGFVWVIKDIEARGTGGNAVEFRLAIAGITLTTIPIPSGQSFGQYSGMVVVNPGETIVAGAAGSGFYYQISGYQLTIPAPGQQSTPQLTPAPAGLPATPV